MNALAARLDDPSERAEAVTGLLAIVRNESQSRHRRARQKAITVIGERNVAEAEDFLLGLWDQDDAEPSLAGYTRAAWLKLRLHKADSVEVKLELLEPLLEADCRWLNSIQIAVDEISNLGIASKLDPVVDAIRRCEYLGEKDRALFLARTKIKLLSESATRIDALAKALDTPDLTGLQKLLLWTVNELAKIDTEESRGVLFSKAKAIQDKYYPEGRLAKLSPERERELRALRYEMWSDSDRFRAILYALRKSMSEEQIRAAGLRPELFPRPLAH